MQLDVRLDANTPQPLPGGPPIECLQIITDGYCCNHCTYCAPSHKAFQNHWYSSVHKNDKTSCAKAYHLGSIQTFFHPSPQHWFEVILGFLHHVYLQST